MPPPPPVSEPQPQPTPPLPSFAGGQFWHSVKDWFERSWGNRFQDLKGAHHKFTHGFTAKVGLNLRTELVGGWSHTTIIGGSTTTVVGFENRINVGFLAKFTFGSKTETTNGNKNEVIWVGLKINHTTGAKRHLIGSDGVDTSDSKAMLEAKINAHWAVIEKMITADLDREAKLLEEDHDKIDSSIKKIEHDIPSLSWKGGQAANKCKTLSTKAKTLMEECGSVDSKTQGKFEIVSKAAADYDAGGELKVKVKGKAKVMGDSLVSFAASISQLG